MNKLTVYLVDELDCSLMKHQPLFLDRKMVILPILQMNQKINTGICCSAMIKYSWKNSLKTRSLLRHWTHQVNLYKSSFDIKVGTPKGKHVSYYYSSGSTRYYLFLKERNFTNVCETGKAGQVDVYQVGDLLLLSPRVSFSGN